MFSSKTIFPDIPNDIVQVEEKEEGREDRFGEGKQLCESNFSSRHPDDVPIKEGLSTGIMEDDNDHEDNHDDDDHEDDDHGDNYDDDHGGFKQLNHLA